MSASLNNIVDVDVQISNPSVVSSDFNLGLIIGESTAILSDKVKIYNSDTYQSEMISDGFLTSDNEYKKALAYFAQNPKSARVAIGAINVAQNENPEDALTAIRGLNSEFYGVCYAEELSSSEISAIAAVVEAMSVPTVFFFSSDDNSCLSSGTTNVFSTLKSAGYTRSIGFYSEDLMIDAAALGLFSGFNSLEPNTAYTFAYKQLASITASDLNENQLRNLISYNGNAYTKFGNTYNFTYPGISSGEFHVDELFLIDAAKHLIQTGAISGLIGSRKVSQTEDGLAYLASFIAGACDSLNTAGYISSGIWRGDAVLDLKPGDAVESGYRIQTGTIAGQSAADRAERKTPPIYVALLASGAFEHVVIRVFVDR